ncbi:Oxysterol-binding protein [Sporormia fimetaria CBS 119925]|uniref:Oxysterol-binding protein n=1 Tax=Sporormia fimetaria CBS 119925 TaxID=1340428 RepID=A0A6A6UWT5_9PLEO|nr:Oxysterol-binding protein [Sporormia fimetaria CBS 119925]
MGASTNTTTTATQARPSLRDFLTTLSSMRGDLTAITAPPFVLAPYSTVELPQYWADHPDLFLAPALAQTPAERALLVLKWFLCSLKNQQYGGRRPEDPLKKPLNAFLGEVFLGSWQHCTHGETKLVAEQVCHHPPITACHLQNERLGIRAEGFTCQEVSLGTSLNIKQKGYAVVHIDAHNEDYLIPVPNIRIKGIWNGAPYPELSGRYTLVSSSGYISEIEFKGKGFISGGTKNGVEARVFHVDRPKEDVYTVSGSWSTEMSFRDAKTGEVVDTFNAETEPSVPVSVPAVEEQDSWESRRAWKGVREALLRGDMRGTIEEKSVVENGQRKLRKQEQAEGKSWQQTFFQRVERDDVFDRLSKVSAIGYEVDWQHGVWKADRAVVSQAQRPFHGALAPTGHVVDPVKRGDSMMEANSVPVYLRDPEKDPRELMVPATGQGRIAV